MSDAALQSWPIEAPSPGLGHRLATHVIATALATALLGAAATLVATALHNLPAPASVAPPVPVVWREIVKPVKIYSLESPLFAGAPVTYTARRHEIGGGREDVLGFGVLDGTRPGLRLRVFRRAAEAPSRAPLLALLAHEAAQIGLSVAHSGVPDLLPTRFGPFETMEVALAGPAAAAVPCQGLRLVRDTPALSIIGLACGGGTVPLTRAAMGCMIERLDVAAARDDRALTDFFAASELKRNAACAGMRLGPDTLHAPWLDDPADRPAQVHKPALAARVTKPSGRSRSR